MKFSLDPGNPVPAAREKGCDPAFEPQHAVGQSLSSRRKRLAASAAASAAVGPEA
jgi:hypothetical protein